MPENGQNMPETCGIHYYIQWSCIWQKFIIYCQFY